MEDICLRDLFDFVCIFVVVVVVVFLFFFWGYNNSLRVFWSIIFMIMLMTVYGSNLIDSYLRVHCGFSYLYVLFIENFFTWREIVLAFHYIYRRKFYLSINSKKDLLNCQTHRLRLNKNCRNRPLPQGISMALNSV